MRRAKTMRFSKPRTLKNRVDKEEDQSSEMQEDNEEGNEEEQYGTGYGSPEPEYEGTQLSNTYLVQNNFEFQYSI